MPSPEYYHLSALNMSALQQETLPQQAARGVTTVALGIKSVSATQGNSIVPLYLPPNSVSVSSSSLYVPPPGLSGFTK